MGDSGGGGGGGRDDGRGTFIGDRGGTYSGDPRGKNFVGPPDVGGFGTGGGGRDSGGTQTHGEQVAAGTADPFGTDAGEVAAAKAARDAEKAAQRASFVGPPERGFFSQLGEDIGEFLGFSTAATAEAAPAELEADRPVGERAQQRAVFAEARANPQTFAGLESRVAALGTGSVTGEEAEALGGLSRSAAEARAAGYDVDVAQRTVSAAEAGFLGFDLSRTIGEFFGEEYSAPLGTFAGFTQTQRAALQSGLAKGTVKSDPTAPQGIAASPIGVLGELVGAGQATKSFGEAAITAQRAARFGLTAAAAPLAGAVVAGTALIGAVRSVAQIGEEFSALGLSPTTAARGISARADGGAISGYEALIAERETATPTQPTQTATRLPVVAPPRRRAQRGAGLASTIRTGFFGAEAPTVRYAR